MSAAQIRFKRARSAARGTQVFPVTTDSASIGQHQALHQHEEFTGALRALLMAPLMTPVHAEFAAVRRHADALRTWFAREAGWPLHIERDCARLFKRPADLADATRGLPAYDRRRYALLCLACAVLERSDPQITLRLLGERLLSLAADRMLESRGFTFALQSPHERRELVAVCRSLLELGVLQRVAGDEEGFVRGDGSDPGAMHDALYDVHRRVLASLLAAVRGPSTWAADEAPVALAERLQSLVAEHVPDSDEGRRTALRHHLSRCLLDDPVVYSDRLPDELRAYFTNQRGTMANRLCEATGLVPEQRAEGLALVDDSGLLSDVAMPAEGTDAHVTLLVAEYLAAQTGATGTTGATGATNDSEVAAFVASVRERYGRFWRKSARETGSEHELAATALERLHKLQLISRTDGAAQALPALARFAIGEADIRRPAPPAATPSLFD